MPAMLGLPSASNDLGLGGVLGDQVVDETEEQRKKRLIGLSPAAKGSLAAQQLFGFGQTGVATAAGSMLGLRNGRGI